MNKRGAIKQIVFFLIGAVVIGGVLWTLMQIPPVWNFVTSSADFEVNTETGSFSDLLGSSWVWMDYVFGSPATVLTFTTNSEVSVVIITLAVWLLLFITFGDIIDVFGTFSEKWIAWSVGLLLSVIAVNLKFNVILLAFFIGIFSFLGGLAVLAGLVAAFVAFIGVNWGVRSWGPWMMRRKIMMEAQRSSVKTEAGGKKLAATIKGLKEAGNALGE